MGKHMVSLILGLLVSCGVLAGAYFFFTKLKSGSNSQELTNLQNEITTVEQRLKDLSKNSNGLASKGQLNSISKMVDKVKQDLEKERANLKAVEEKLGISQKNVETKEFQQQEVKAAKDEDETKLNELLSSYTDLSAESIELEQKLAQSMKNLDKMIAELPITDDQRVVLDKLNASLTSAGSLLRELITECELVNERLKVLKEQHVDLEEEYTRLVEQQLGD